jgi:hypothetical protein
VVQRGRWSWWSTPLPRAVLEKRMRLEPGKEWLDIRPHELIPTLYVVALHEGICEDALTTMIQADYTTAIENPLKAA